eukprot:gene18244-20064_t
MEQLLCDAKLLVKRLQHHDNAADSLISDATNLESKLLAMREYQDEVTNLNEIARHRPRSTLILGSQLENQRINALKNENRELHLSLTEHQSALELIMNKYREQVLNLLSQKGTNKSSDECMTKNPADVGALTEKITEMAAVMQRAAKADEAAECMDVETVAKLKFENKTLRELLHISGHPKREIEKLRIQANLHSEIMMRESLTSSLSDAVSLDLDSSADEMENKTGTVKRKIKDALGNECLVNGFGNSSGDDSIAGKVLEKSGDTNVPCDEADKNHASNTDMMKDIEPDKMLVDEVVVNSEVAENDYGESEDILKQFDEVIESSPCEVAGCSDEGNLVDSRDLTVEEEAPIFSTSLPTNEASGYRETEAMDAFIDDKGKESDEEELLELYNSEGLLLDASCEGYGAIGGTTYDGGKLKGLKIRKSSKQKKVIQANLKTFFEKESQDDDGVAELDDSSTKRKTGSEFQQHTQLSDCSMIEEDVKKDSDAHLCDPNASSNPTVERESDNVKEISEESIGILSLTDMTEAHQCDARISSETEIPGPSSGGIADDACCLAPTREFTAAKNPAKDSNDNERARTGLAASEMTKGGPENPKHSDSADSGRASSSSDGVDDASNRATHRTIQLDFSDSDSDDAEQMIEDQFADIIAGKGDDVDSSSNSGSSSSGSSYSDHEPDFEGFEPTEEELVGDLDEGGEFVMKHWTRPLDQFDHLSDSWIEGDSSNADNPTRECGGVVLEDRGTDSSIEGKDSQGKDVDGSEAVATGKQMFEGDDSKLEAEGEEFSFLKPNYQIDQFTGGSIKAKYAKRKTYENASKASAVTLSSRTASNSPREESAVNKDEICDESTRDKDRSSSSGLSSQSSSDSQVDIAASDSSSGEIDPMIFKRRISVDPQPMVDNEDNCAGHLNELLSDLDAALDLPDEDYGGDGDD